MSAYPTFWGPIILTLGIMSGTGVIAVGEVEGVASIRPDQWAGSNLPWIASLAGILFALVKVVRVADLDVSTTLGVLSAAGPVNVTLGVVATSAPVAAPLALGCSTVWWVRSVRRGGAMAFSLALFAASLLVTVQATPLVDVAAVAIAAIGFAVLRLLVARDRVRRRAASVLTRSEAVTNAIAIFMGAVMLVSGAALVMNRQVWLPSERLSLSDGTHQIGYVLSVNNGWVTVLAEKPRQIQWIRIEDLSARSLCRVHRSSSSPSIAQLIEGRGGPQHYPRCQG